MGLIESILVLYVWCKSKFDKIDVFLLKFISIFDTRSSIIKHQPLTIIPQPSTITSQSSDSNLSQLKINAKVRFHSTLPLYLNKLLIKTVKQSPFSGNLKFEGMPQIGKLVNLRNNVRFLAIFAGEGV